MLQLRDINKKFGDKVIYADFSIAIGEAVTTCILGPSGCGKTTLLDIISKSPEVEGRKIAYIFQEPRLLPWKTVRGNIEFVLDDIMTDDKNKYVNDYLRLVEMQDFADLYPSQLSGGMSHRVSIARALATQPDIILMDEPFSGLNMTLKNNIINKVNEIFKSTRKTVIYVTHDVDEALMLSEDIIVIGETPAKILYERRQIDKKDTLIIKKDIAKFA